MDQLRQWGRSLLLAGCVASWWGQAVAFAAEAAPQIEAAPPFSSYWPGYLIVVLLVALGTAVVCLKRLYPQRRREEFVRF